MLFLSVIRGRFSGSGHLRATRAGTRHAAALLLVFFVVAGCRTAGPSRDSVETLATYDGGGITREEYDDWLVAKNRDPDPERLREDLEKIAVTEVLAEAGESGMDPVDRFMVERAEVRVLARTFQEFQSLRDISFTDEELRHAFEGNPQNLYKPQKYRLYEVFLRIPPEATPEEWAAKREEAQELRRRILEGAEIGGLAREHSDSDTRLRGGYVGVVDPAVLAPEISEAVSELEVGEITPVLETPDGLLVLSCDLVVPERRNTFEGSRDKVRSILVRRESQRRWERLQGELLLKADPAYDLRALQDPDTPDSTPVVRFNGEVWKLNQASALIRSGSRADASMVQLREPAVRSLLDGAVVQSMSARMARELGLDGDQRVQARVRWARKEILSMQELARRVALRLTPPGNGEIEYEITSNPARYRQPPAYLLSVIRIGGSPSDLRARYQNGARLAAQLEAGTIEFGEAAISGSDHASAAEGGDVGWLTPPQLAGLGSAVAASVLEMEVGEIKGPVQEGAAIWILELRDDREPRSMTFSEARPVAEQRLGNHRARSLQIEIEAEILNSMRIEANGNLPVSEIR